MWWLFQASFSLLWPSKQLFNFLQQHPTSVCLDLYLGVHETNWNDNFSDAPGYTCTTSNKKSWLRETHLQSYAFCKHEQHEFANLILQVLICICITGSTAWEIESVVTAPTLPHWSTNNLLHCLIFQPIINTEYLIPTSHIPWLGSITLMMSSVSTLSYDHCHPCE